LRREEEALLTRNILVSKTGRSLKITGRRWIVEIIFSSFKRVLGEVLRSRKFLCQKVEALFKVMLYNNKFTATYQASRNIMIRKEKYAQKQLGHTHLRR
jgi:hypothetical protein